MNIITVSSVDEIRTPMYFPNEDTILSIIRGYLPVTLDKHFHIGKEAYYNLQRLVGLHYCDNTQGSLNRPHASLQMVQFTFLNSIYKNKKLIDKPSIVNIVLGLDSSDVYNLKYFAKDNNMIIGSINKE